MVEDNSICTIQFDTWIYSSVWCSSRQAHIRVCYTLQSSINLSTYTISEYYTIQSVINFKLMVPKGRQLQEINKDAASWSANTFRPYLLLAAVEHCSGSTLHIPVAYLQLVTPLLFVDQVRLCAPYVVKISRTAPWKINQSIHKCISMARSESIDHRPASKLFSFTWLFSLLVSSQMHLQFGHQAFGLSPFILVCISKWCLPDLYYSFTLLIMFHLCCTVLDCV